MEEGEAMGGLPSGDGIEMGLQAYIGVHQGRHRVLGSIVEPSRLASSSVSRLPCLSLGDGFVGSLRAEHPDRIPCLCPRPLWAIPKSRSHCYL